MTHHRFAIQTTAKLSLILVVASCIAIVGCGGGDPGSFNSSDDTSGNSDSSADTDGSDFGSLRTETSTSALSPAQIATIENRLKQIGIGIHNHHSAYKKLPKAFVADADGKPIRSWRVKLLPYIDAQPLWEQWNQDEAWDAGTNAELLFKTPELYRSVHTPASGPHSGDCHVFAIRASNSLMGDGSKDAKFRDVLDGLSNTVMFVYVPGRSVPWAAPTDLTVDEAFAEFSKATVQQPAFMVMGDGAVFTVTKPIDRTLFDALMSRNGAETIESLDFN